MPKILTKPRCRSITFRVTEREFESIVSACQHHGFSISDFARAALLDSVANATGGGPLTGHIYSLDRKLSDLGTTFAHLIENIENLNRIAGTRLDGRSDNGDS